MANAVVYHGTSREGVDAILRDGFVDVEVLDAHGQPVSGVFVTSDASVAGRYGEVVLAVEIDATTAAGIAEDIRRWDETVLPAATLNRCSVRAVPSTAVRAIADDQLKPDEHAWLMGYITSLILGGLRRNEDRATQVRPLAGEDGALTSRLGITTESGRQYVLSITPVADAES